VWCVQVQLALQQLESSCAQVSRLEADLRDYKARAQVRQMLQNLGLRAFILVTLLHVQSDSVPRCLAVAMHTWTLA
jgi:hypothetical protein